MASSGFSVYGIKKLRKQK